MPKGKKSTLLSGLDFELSSVDFDLVDISFDETMTPNPLASVNYTGDVEDDSPKEISALLTAWKSKAAQEKKRFEQATDSEFWFAVCFQTREQKDAFLVFMEWSRLGDKYLDGCKVAKLMNVPIPATDLKHQAEKTDRKITALPSIAD